MLEFHAFPCRAHWRVALLEGPRPCPVGRGLGCVGVWRHDHHGCVRLASPRLAPDRGLAAHGRAWALLWRRRVLPWTLLTHSPARGALPMAHRVALVFFVTQFDTAAWSQELLSPVIYPSPTMADASPSICQCLTLAGAQGYSVGRPGVSAHLRDGARGARHGLQGRSHSRSTTTSHRRRPRTSTRSGARARR